MNLSNIHNAKQIDLPRNHSNPKYVNALHESGLEWRKHNYEDQYRAIDEILIWTWMNLEKGKHYAKW